MHIEASSYARSKKEGKDQELIRSSTTPDCISVRVDINSQYNMYAGNKDFGETESEQRLA